MQLFLKPVWRNQRGNQKP